MIDPGSLPPAAQAAALIGVVLFEAIILYLGYGAAESLLGPPIIKRLKNV